MVRAGLGIAKGETVPALDGTGRVQRNRISESLLDAPTSTQTRYGFGIDASW